MIRELKIKNYKSILDHTIELGRVNVFIGENGCGKTNILEAMAMVGAVVANRLDLEELYTRGIRVARPAITFSSFVGVKQSKEIKFTCEFDSRTGGSRRIELCICVKEASAVDVSWFDKNERLDVDQGLNPDSAAKLLALSQYLKSTYSRDPSIPFTPDDYRKVAAELVTALGGRGAKQFLNWIATQRFALGDLLNEFTIYDLNVLALRGIQNVSRRAPLGIYGENLDVAISMMADEERKDLLDRARCISWLDEIIVDTGDELKYQGHKFGRSTSTLYFRDRFMGKRTNIFSAENANEGILHILFYLVLFASSKTPKVFGIDNIETALNPQLCRELIKQLAELAKKHDKQALITTHNPAILDGLNLHDDEQRLFVVSRNDAGHTVTERIKLKPKAKAGKYKLSELWMRGFLGGIPQRF